MAPQLSSREVSAILAGLQLLRDVYAEAKMVTPSRRHLTEEGQHFTWTSFHNVHPVVDVLTDGGTLEPLTRLEIDALAERINILAAGQCNTRDFKEVDHSI